jgi:hypothetical protein
MKKVLALAGVIGAPLALAIPSLLPKVALMLLIFFPLGTASIFALVLPILIIGLLGLLGNPPSDSLLFIL